MQGRIRAGLIGAPDEVRAFLALLNRKGASLMEDMEVLTPDEYSKNTTTLNSVFANAHLLDESSGEVVWIVCTLPRECGSLLVPSNLVVLSDMVGRDEMSAFISAMPFPVRTSRASEMADRLVAMAEESITVEHLRSEASALKADKFRLCKKNEALEKELSSAGRKVESILEARSRKIAHLRLVGMVFVLAASLFTGLLLFGAGYPAETARALCAIHNRLSGDKYEVTVSRTAVAPPDAPAAGDDKGD